MSRVIIVHFGDESLQSVTCTGTDHQTTTTKRQNTYKTQTNARQKVAILNNNTKHSKT